MNRYRKSVRSLTTIIIGYGHRYGVDAIISIGVRGLDGAGGKYTF